MFEAILDQRKPNWKLRIACTVLVLSLAMGFVWIWRMTQMPLKSYKGPLQPLSDEESQLGTRCSAHVTYVSETVGERSLARPGSLQAVTDYLRDTLKQAGYAATEHTYSIEGHAVRNIEVSLVGSDNSSGPVIVVGAHY